MFAIAILPKLVWKRAMSAPQDGSIIARCFPSARTRIARPWRAACRVATIPLSNAPNQASGRWVVPFGPKQMGSELSRQVPVDLEADADLNKGRGCPGH